LFGSPVLEGGQAQFVRVPRAGGTLFNLSNPSTWSSSNLSETQKLSALKTLSDSSLLLLADILPTGVFAALQAMNHPKVLPVVTGRPWPTSFFADASSTGLAPLHEEDKVLTFAIIGLGPVGVCSAVSLLDMLASRDAPFKIVAIDPLESRRRKMKAIYSKIAHDGKGTGKFVVRGIEEAKETVNEWTRGVGATAVLEVREIFVKSAM
jgi:threonine dehydrogenase-like Zn-dependent dehydrogenase